MGRHTDAPYVPGEDILPGLSGVATRIGAKAAYGDLGERVFRAGHLADLGCRSKNGVIRRHEHLLPNT